MPTSSRRRATAVLAAAVAVSLLPSSAGAQASADSPITKHPYERGAIGLEFSAGLLTEAWNLNNTHETLVTASAGAWWTFAHRASLLVDFQAVRVFQESSRNAWVNGLTTMVRWHALVRDRWSLFADLGPGISWSDTSTPPGGTAFNYLIVADAGALARLGDQSRVLAGFRWLHISNSGREGRARNPDIEAIGPYVGISIAF